MNYIVHSFFSSFTPKFDHKTPQVLFSPWMEILFTPNILPAMLNLIKVRLGTPHPLIQTSTFTLLQAQDSLKEM